MKRLLWHAADLRPDDLTPFLIGSMVDARLNVVVQDEDGRYVCITGLPHCWSTGVLDNPTDLSIFGAKVAALLGETKAAALLTGSPEQMDLPFGEDEYFEFRVLPFRCDDGRMWIVITIMDRSAERRREQEFRALLREVSHRSKNMLAITQALATQTSRHSESVGVFVEKFKGRLFSIASSQDLITESGWRGVGVQELLHGQAAVYLLPRSGRIKFSGENLLLPPNAVTHVGLAFHELIVNAVEHGTFVKKSDTIDVSCRLRNIAGQRRVRITWKEPIDPDLDGAVEKRFGSTLLERLVPMAVSGTASLDIQPQTVSYTLDLPLIDAGLPSVDRPAATIRP